tara:strand:+ start:1042 stop:1329 length:288 start_codon:yes stop_codon:yes gene_type:complete
MLIKKPHAVGDVVSLKLSTGEEIIGRLEEETDTGLNIKKPMAIVMGQQGLALAPYMFSTINDQVMTFKNTNVMTVGITLEEISKQYVEQTTGIVT